MSEVITNKKKKVVTRKEKLRIAEEVAKKRLKEEENERLMIQREQERVKRNEEEREHLEREIKEQQIREIKLRDSSEFFKKHQTAVTEFKLTARSKSCWQKWISCDRFCRLVPSINEYVSRSKVEKPQRFVKAKENILKGIEILKLMEHFMDDPFNIKSFSIWIECKTSLRDFVYERLDASTYLILRNVEKEMDYIDLETMNFKEFDDCFKFLLWTTLERQKEEKSYQICNFEECGVSIQLPKSLSHISIAVRCLWMRDDFYSDDCRTSWSWKLQDGGKDDIIEWNRKYWKRKKTLYEERAKEEARLQMERDKRKRLINKIKYLLPSSAKTDTEEENFENSTKQDIEPSTVLEMSKEDSSEAVSSSGTQYVVRAVKKTIEQILKEEELTVMDGVKKSLEVKVEAHELNMRRFNLIGGLYHLDLLKQPSQPKMMKDGSTLTFLIGPDCLQRWNYQEVYEPSSVQSKQSTDDEDEDVENTAEGRLLSKIVLVSLKIPTHVLWFDVPTPVHWETEHQRWSTEFVYDVKFNEEKQILTFRAGKMTTFGLAVFKYSNLPYQTWEMKPNLNSNLEDEVFLSITAAIVVADFVIRGNKVCLCQLQNAGGTVLDHLIGVFHEPRELLRVMLDGGIDIFPKPDAFLYLENVPNKDPFTENHFYRSMSTLCLNYCYSWSRWNLGCGYKKFVAQIKESNAQTENNKLLLVTTSKAVIVDCTEVSQKFSEQGLPGMEFYPDFYNLALNRLTDDSKSIFLNIDPVFAETVYFMLSQTRVLSFS